MRPSRGIQSESVRSWTASVIFEDKARSFQALGLGIVRPEKEVLWVRAKTCIHIA